MSVNLEKLLALHAECERRGIKYGLGAKAPAMAATPAQIARIDCSGYVRWLLWQASGGALKLPDGSQNQRDWCEKNLREVGSYRDAAQYMTGKRLFIAFIRPGYNGCGPVGHVWLLLDGDPGMGVTAETVESYGGHGPGSRPWNARTLMREVYSVFELPVSEK